MSAGNVGIASTRGRATSCTCTCAYHCKNTPRIIVDAVMTARLNPFKSVELLSLIKSSNVRYYWPIKFFQIMRAFNPFTWATSSLFTACVNDIQYAQLISVNEI